MTAQPQFPDEQNSDGTFARQDDAFREWVTAGGESGYPAQAGRYHLYVSYACPWAHRTIIVRKLKKLEGVVSMTVVDPIRDERGWAIRDVPGASPRDDVNGFSFLSEAYAASDAGYRGRVTVPVLWDKQTKRIVSNSDDDIMRMFETQFEAFADPSLDLYPRRIAGQIDKLNEHIYDTLNNGVYKAGFATQQHAYEFAARRVFATLDELEERLGDRPFLFGDQPVETDWRAFVTLLRFDPVYFGHFKCNVREIRNYPNLYRYLRALYHVPGVSETVNMDHIKRHYYYTHDDINPTRIVPIGPDERL